MYANIQGYKIPIYSNLFEFGEPCLIRLDYPKFTYNPKSEHDFKIHTTLPLEIDSDEGFVERKGYKESTWEQSDYRFILYRLGRISSTHFASAVGYNKYKSKLDCAFDLFGCHQEFSTTSLEKMSIGTFLEPHVINSYMKATKNEIQRAGFCVSSKDTRIGFSPDGFCKLRDNSEGIIECKGVEKLYPLLENRLIDCHVKNIKSNNYDHISITHFCQMQGIMHLSNKKYAEYCVGLFNPNSNTSYMYYERLYYDSSFCEKMFSNIDNFFKEEYSYVKNISDKILL
jgi:hypothetical protein